jgi:hypothetical protein
MAGRVENMIKERHQTGVCLEQRTHKRTLYA